MAGIMKSRYGLDGKTVSNLNTRWRRKYSMFTTWKSLDDFLKWVSETGYVQGRHLCRYDENKPWGPENAYWKEKANIEKPKAPPIVEKSPEYLYKWQQDFIQNWNAKIHRKMKVEIPKKPREREFFKYEHPDLVREGIVFEGYRGV